MNIEDVRRVLVVGAGTMGVEIGFQCARHGYDVALYDHAPEVLDTVVPRLKARLEQLAMNGDLSQVETDAALARMTTKSDAREAAQEVDLVSEAIPEDPKLKGEVFARFNELCPSRTVLPPTRRRSYRRRSPKLQDDRRGLQLSTFTPPFG
jgi:3-hydroxybutyryl-CoA dehydrogenase